MEAVRGIVEALRVKQSFDLGLTGDGRFDMRALAYVCGVIVAQTASGGSVSLGNDAAAVRLWQPSWNAPSAADLVVGPNIARTGSDMVTFTRIARMAGVENVIMLADSVPGVNSRLHTGLTLGAYALRIFTCVMERADAASCASHHMLAFWRGMNKAVSLHAHTDEGGFVRAPLKAATYPRSCGVLTCGLGGFIELPTAKDLVRSEVTRVALAIHLTMAGLFSVSGINDDGHYTVFEGNGQANQRPSTLDGLESEMYDVLSVMRRKIERMFGFGACAVTDRHSMKNYFAADPVNRHIDGTFLSPLNYVEPSGLLVESDEPALVASHGKAVMMPLCANRGVFFNPGCFEVGGRVVSGATLFVVKEKGNIRHDAMSYLMSAEYNKANGLGQVEYCSRADLGTSTTDAMFVAAGVTNGAYRRWVTPHNPMPNVNEAFSTLPLSFSYVYRGIGREPSKDDWTAAKFTSVIGHFHVGQSSNGKPKRLSHDVPPHIKLFIENANRQAPLTDMGRLLQYLPGVEPAAENVVIPTPPTTESDGLGDLTSPTIEDLEPQPDNEGAEAGLETSHDIGVKPAMPDA